MRSALSRCFELAPAHEEIPGWLARYIRMHVYSFVEIHARESFCTEIHDGEDGRARHASRRNILSLKKTSHLSAHLASAPSARCAMMDNGHRPSAWFCKRSKCVAGGAGNQASFGRSVLAMVNATRQGSSQGQRGRKATSRDKVNRCG